MSFSTRVKEDLTRVLSSKKCCRRAEFIAFFLINGHIRIEKGHQLSLFMLTEHAASLRKMFTLAKDFSLTREITVYRRTRLHKNQVFTLTVPPQPQLLGFLRELSLLDAHGRWHLGFPERLREDILDSPCCRRAYLRGAFLACGSLTEPESFYHLEFGSLEKAQADLLVELMAEYELKAKIVRRKDREIVYLKGAEEISQLMNIMGSHRSLLEFESLRVTKEIRNQANRQRNCDTANVNKVVSAGWRQVQDINFIAETIGLEILPRNLRVAAELRLEYPDYSLADLSEASSLGRSALNHRLRRLSQIALNIHDFGPPQWDREEDS
jgi:cell division protein WhiA